jgi:hypothetical protein
MESTMFHRGWFGLLAIAESFGSINLVGELS